MKRGTVKAFLSAAVLTGVLAVAAPASAGTTGPIGCGNAQVSGSTEATGQITFLTGSGQGHCGVLSLRTYYSHPGGASWTLWKNSAYAGGGISHSIGNSLKSDHKTSIGALYFTSYR